MDCPHCRTQVRSISCDDIDVQICPACGGIWLDSQQVSRFSESAGSGDVDQDPFTIPVLNSTLACPRCDGAPPLYLVGLTGEPELKLDICQGCHGLFVDPDEIQAIKRYLKWGESNPDDIRDLTIRPLLLFIDKISEVYAPDTWGRPSWDDEAGS